MSDYVRIKALRIPLDKINMELIYAKLRQEDKDFMDDLSFYLEKFFPDLFSWRGTGKFTNSPTVTPYIDYVLDYEYGADGEYGRTRALYDSEKNKYRPVFQKIDPNVDMNFVCLVEFCWYNGSEAPDYYDDTNDPFYDEA